MLVNGISYLHRPLWLSPRQVVIIPVAQSFNAYADELHLKLKELGFFADVDTSALTLNKKIRNGQILLYNYILVVGEEEAGQEAVNVRSRDDDSKKSRGEVVKFTDFVASATKAVQSYQ